MSLIKQLFTWWDGQSAGTRLWTWRKGVKVGADSQGNIYYRERARDRRWVIYNGPVDASRIPPEWHGWLHHTVNELPNESTHKHKKYERPHLSNQTGTPSAYRPKGSILTGPDSAVTGAAGAAGAYEAWRPDA
jgi:NADH:ubiquinone oxidoreductase subunit